MDRREFFMVLIAAGLTQLSDQLARLQGEQERIREKAAIDHAALSELAGIVWDQESRLNKLVWDVAWIRERVRGGGVGPLPFKNPGESTRRM